MGFATRRSKAGNHRAQRTKLRPEPTATTPITLEAYRRRDCEACICAAQELLTDAVHVCGR